MPPRIPLAANGKPHPITSRQFRRTLAGYIATQPGGSVAGMVQYAHLNITTFEGYADTSDWSLGREIEQAREIARQPDLIEMYENTLRGAPSAGNHHPQLVQELASLGIEDELTFKGRVVDDDRLQKLLVLKAKKAHPGQLNLCIYEEATSMCRRESAGEEGGPSFSRCAPTRCASSYIGPQHIQAWERNQAAWEETLAQAPGPLQQAKAEHQIQTAERTLRALRGLGDEPMSNEETL